MKRPTRVSHNRARESAFARQMGVQEGWSGLNAYGRLKVLLMMKLGCKFAFDHVYDAVANYVAKHISAAEACEIEKDERQIARHAMIIKLTRL